MDESSASGAGRGKNKRFWTPEENTTLVNALCEMANDPHWKCENGFRSGYMNRLEEIINKAHPKSGLRAIPHIDSRLKTLSQKYRAIVQMLGVSGFQWNDEKSMIYVDKSAYDEYCKVHPNCKKLYDVPFPHFHALGEVYGKDYATGKSAEDFLEAIGNMEKSTQNPITFESSSDEDHGSVQSAPPLKKIKRENNSKRKGGRKESEKGGNSELTSLQSFMKEMNVHLCTMASAMNNANEREKQHAEKSENVLDELLSLGGLTPEEIFRAARILTAQPNDLMIFSKCPEALKRLYIKELVSGSNTN